MAQRKVIILNNLKKKLHYSFHVQQLKMTMITLIKGTSFHLFWQKKQQQEHVHKRAQILRL